MKGIKYLVIALTIAAILAVVGWVLRNTLIERISSPILADFDVELIDVSLDTLATNAASIGYLELVHDKGTQIVIEDLKLPINTPENNARLYSARKVSIITATRDDGAPFELARLINQFLSLTEVVPKSEIRIAEFSLSTYPTVHDLRWALTDTDQLIDGSIESIRMSAVTSRTDESVYDVGFSLVRGSGAMEVSDTIEGKLISTDSGVSISGESSIELPAWQTVASLVGILPEAIMIESGTGDLLYGVDVPFAVEQSPTVSATLAPASPWQFSVAAESGSSSDVLMRDGSVVEIRATFPKIEWSLRQANATLLVASDEWRNIPLSASEISCQSGPVCSMGANISWIDAETPIGSAGSIQVSSAITISFPTEGIRIEVQPDASLELSSLSSPDNSIDRLIAGLASTASMQYTENGWHFVAASVDAEIESLAINDDVVLTSTLYLDNVEIRELDSVVSASTGIVAPSSTAGLDSRNVTLPGLSGDVSLQDGIVAFDFATTDLFENGSIKGNHNVDSGVGALAIADTTLSFDSASPSTRITPWDFDFDIMAGTLAAGVDTKWGPSDSGTRVETRSSIRLESLAGFYTDIVFTGLSTDIELYLNDAGINVDPMAISVGLVEMGLPIENISAVITPNLTEQSIAVENLEMTAFNGLVTAAPFSFRTGQRSNNITLTAKEIELAELLTIKEFAALDVTGTMGAVLPITIAEDGISIDGGTLTGEPPGGVIRYLAGGNPNESGPSNMALVTAALSNFEYETLTSDVTYNEGGDLILQMQLKGRNPELDDGRPVVLNLAVENNVPQMLKSLQAARAVEEVLEKRLGN